MIAANKQPAEVEFWLRDPYLISIIICQLSVRFGNSRNRYLLVKKEAPLLNTNPNILSELPLTL